MNGLTDHQQCAINVLNSLPEELRQHTSRGSLLVGIARHLRQDLGVSCVAAQASVGNRNRGAGTEYLLVDDLRISRWGEVGDRAIIRGAFRRIGSGKAPTAARFNPTILPDFPGYFNEKETQHAAAVCAWLRQGALEAQIQQDTRLPVMRYAHRCLTQLMEEPDVHLVSALVGVAQHLRKDLGVDARVKELAIDGGTMVPILTAVLLVEGMEMDAQGRTERTAITQAVMARYSLSRDPEKVRVVEEKSKIMNERTLEAAFARQARAIYLKLSLQSPQEHADTEKRAGNSRKM